MSNTIKIDGDFSAVKKGIMELSKEMKGLTSKQQVSLFSKEDAALLSRQTVDVTKSLNKELDKANKNAERYKRLLKSNTLSEEKKVKAAKSYNKILKDRAVIQKNLNKISDFSSSVQGPSRISQIRGGLGQGARNLPGMGMMGNLGKMGLMGGLGMLGGAALGFGAYKGIQGYQQFKGGAAQRLMMGGRGIEDTSGMNASLGNLGYSPTQIREQQLKGQAAFGAGGGTQGAVLQRAQFERARGLDKGSMMEATSGFRGAMGGKSAQEAMYKLQATILANEITDNIGPFLENSSMMLTQMNEQGLPVDNELLGMFASMTKGGMSEKRAAQQIMNVNQAIKGSSGDSNAFLQSMFAQAGIGGGTVGGAQEAIRAGGLFGMDRDKMKNQWGMSDKDIAAYEGLNIAGKGTGFKERTQGMLDYSKENFGTSKEETLRKGEFFKQIFGTQTGGEALGFLNKIDEAKGDPKKIAKIEKEIKEAAKSPEMKIQEDIRKGIQDLNGIDSRIEANTGTSLQKLEGIGRAVGDTGIMIEETLTSIDGAVLAIAGMLTGYQSSKERKAEANAEAASQRKEQFSAGLKSVGISSLEGMGKEETEAQLAKARGALSAKAKEWREFKGGDEMGIPGFNKMQKDRLGKEAEMKADVVTALEEHLRVIAEATKKTAENTKNKKGGVTPSNTRGKN